MGIITEEDIKACEYKVDMGGEIYFCKARSALCSDVRAKGNCPKIIQILSKDNNNVNPGANPISK